MFSDFTAEACEILFCAGKEYLLESSAPDGRYPKIWDRAAIRRMRETTGARIVPMAMCAWGLSPPNQPTKRYRKNTWWLVSPKLYMYALLLARRCDHGRDQHVALRGVVPREITAAQAAKFNKDKSRVLSPSEQEQITTAIECTNWPAQARAAVSGSGSCLGATNDSNLPALES